jgi:hypothetical protein
MKNENEILDKTYTLNSVNSYFDDTCLCLNALLPREDSENPYSYTAFDLTQMIDNTIVNAVLVFMKKRVDNGDDLSGSDDDINEVNYTFDQTNLQKLSGTLPGIFDFEIKNNETLVMLCHDSADDMSYMTEFAEKVYLLVPAIQSKIIISGNFQTTLNVMGTDPKKAGMSTLPKK